MSGPADQELVEDMHDAARRVEQYGAGHTEESFVADPVLQDAASFRLLALGEAAAHVSEGFKAAHPDLPWKEMIGVRNFLGHGYKGVSAGALWEMIASDVPKLIDQLSGLVGRARE